SFIPSSNCGWLARSRWVRGLSTPTSVSASPAPTWRQRQHPSRQQSSHHAPRDEPNRIPLNVPSRVHREQTSSPVHLPCTRRERSVPFRTGLITRSVTATLEWLLRRCLAARQLDDARFGAGGGRVQPLGNASGPPGIAA